MASQQVKIKSTDTQTKSAESYEMRNDINLRGVDGDGEVLVLLEEGEFGALVDGTLVDGVGHGEVDDAAQQDPVADLGVDVAPVVRQRQDVLHVRLHLKW